MDENIIDRYNEGYDDGVEEGHDDGYDEGFEDARKEALEDMDNLHGRIDELEDAIRRARISLEVL